jgi:DeoR/GlpR family transcriptional regulator of sugar metabolism
MSELARQRRAHIVEQVQLTGGGRVSELTRLFGVSDMTIRPDLNTLAKRGLVAKVHGGAIRADPSTEEPAFASKAVRELTEKDAIAAEAAALVRPGTAIALTAGTTTWALARHQAGIPPNRAFTDGARQGGRPRS